MGRKAKQLAESLFNHDAKPVTLNFKLDDFLNYSIRDDVVKDSQEDISYPEIFPTNILDIPIPPESLIIMANDLDPQTRDEEADKAVDLLVERKESEIGHIPTTELLSVSSDKLENLEKVDTVKFKIAHSKIKADNKPVTQNKITSAVRMVNLAIDKMSDDLKKKFKMKTDKVIKHDIFSKVLIDDSSQSIEFINSLGYRILTRLKTKFPDRFKNFPDSEKLYIEWLNKSFKKRNKLDLVILCSIVATRINRTNIILNDYCGIEMGFDLFGCVWTTHQYLHFLNLHTIDVKSDRFYNFAKLVFNFSSVYGGKRLYYLEYIAKSFLEDDKLFVSDNHLFSEEVNKRWKNEKFPEYSNCVDVTILRKLLVQNVKDSNN